MNRRSRFWHFLGLSSYEDTCTAIQQQNQLLKDTQKINASLNSIHVDFLSIQKELDKHEDRSNEDAKKILGQIGESMDRLLLAMETKSQSLADQCERLSRNACDERQRLSDSLADQLCGKWNHTANEIAQLRSTLSSGLEKLDESWNTCMSMQESMRSDSKHNHDRTHSAIEETKNAYNIYTMRMEERVAEIHSAFEQLSDCNNKLADSLENGFARASEEFTRLHTAQEAQVSDICVLKHSMESVHAYNKVLRIEASKKDSAYEITLRDDMMRETVIGLREDLNACVRVINALESMTRMLVLNMLADDMKGV
jgi:hypothetical protein